MFKFQMLKLFRALLNTHELSIQLNGFGLFVRQPLTSKVTEVNEIMANLVQNCRYLRPILPLLRHSRACSSLGATSLMERVQNRIDTKRQQALLGGGKKRIEAQHKRVSPTNLEYL